MKTIKKFNGVGESIHITNSTFLNTHHLALLIYIYVYIYIYNHHYFFKINLFIFLRKTMNFIPLEITINSADILKNVNCFNRKRIYTRVSLIGNNQIATRKTHVDEHNGSKPFWWFKMKFQVEESKIHEKSCMLVFQVRCSKTLGDKDIGFLYLPVKELFDGGQKYPRDVAYTVATQSGKPKGVLYLTYKFGERVGTSSVIRVKRVEEITRFGPVPSAPPCFLLEGDFPAGTTPLAPSAPPYIGEDSC